MLSSQVHRYRCAQCWGPVVLKCVEGEWTVVCPKDCSPGGFVSENYVNYRQMNDAIDTAKVAANYPDLNPHKPKPENAGRAAEALFGQEE
ncbi:MAG: hypothetical protein MUO37_12180 [Methyloceanibacter sp.]|nr:hypothetical protein [Methyloceanibacter sp.]